MTTIRQQSYHLCKAVWKSLDRDRIREIIRVLNQAPKEGETRADRSGFGYASRQIGQQTLGYLIVNRDKEQLQQNFPPLVWSASLQQSEKVILEGVHKQFVQLDKACVEPLTNVLPQCAFAVDPYNVHRYEISEQADDVTLFPQNILQKLVDSFHKHPAFPVAIATAQLISDLPIQEQLAQSVIELEKIILSTGAMSSPRMLADTLYTYPDDSPQRILLRYLSALLCVKSALATLNELVFQAILSNKLPVISEDNIIELGSLTAHTCGQGFSLTCQPDGYINPFNMNLVLVKCSSLEFPIDLCRVEEVHFQSSQDYGDTIDFQLRLIDEQLNPYGNLLKLM